NEAEQRQVVRVDGGGLPARDRRHQPSFRLGEEAAVFAGMVHNVYIPECERPPPTGSSPSPPDTKPHARVVRPIPDDHHVNTRNAEMIGMSRCSRAIGQADSSGSWSCRTSANQA